MRLKILLAASLCVLFTCSRDNSRENKNHTDGAKGNADTSQVSLAEAVPVVENVRSADSAVAGVSVKFPRPGQVRILTTGTFHGDEVWEGADEDNWYGLFSDQEGFSVRRTKIITTRVSDGLLDDEEKGEKTGWEVQTEASESPILLITGLDLAETKTTSADIPSAIYPGDSINFTYEGIPYSIFAKGERLIANGAITSVTNYDLYISKTIEGKTTVDLLVSHSAFDDTMTSVIWAGDIDADKKLDLIIDLSNHYNVTSPTLFLSVPSNENDIVIQVGQHTRVGC